MKLGVISDLHIDANHQAGKPVLEVLVKQIQEKGVDGMLIPGDVSNDYQITLNTLETLQDKSGVPCYFVPGNHDVWNEKHPGEKTWDIYRKLLAFKGNLANGPQDLSGKWALVGDTGWYDYSFGSEDIPLEDFHRMQFENRIWQDRLKAVWDRPTVDMHRYFVQKIEDQLKELEGKNIILMTHVVPHRAFTVQNPSPMWRYLNAFLGSAAYGELASQYGACYAVFGHVHYRMVREVKQTIYLCSCLGTHDEWGLYPGKSGTTAAIRDAFQVIHLADQR